MAAIARPWWRDVSGGKTVATLCLAVGLTACGTTVGQTPIVSAPQQSASTTDNLGAEVGGAGNPSARTQAAGSLNPGNGSSAITANGGFAVTGNGGYAVTGPALNTAGGNPGTATGSGNGPASASGGVPGRGITASTITVGIPLPSDTSAVGSNFGISGAGSVSPQDMVAAVTNDVNRSGGILGRKLLSYVHSYSLATYISNPAQADGEICSDFRDDNKVFTVISNIVDEYLLQCTAAMGSPLIIADGNGAYLPAADYNANGGNFLFGPTAITAEELAHLFVESLMARNFAQPWNTLSGGPGATPPRLGLIHVDSPDQNAYYADISKELANYGLKFTDTFTYSDDASDALAGTQSAVLKFKAEGVTHVFGASAFFLDDAESQKYRPRYAYLPGLGQLGAENVPAAQMNGALTVGWAPAIDVAAQQDPGDTPGAKHCRAVMTAAGLSVANRNDLENMYSVCDALYSLRSALHAGRTPTVQGLRSGYESLGTSFPTALSFSADLGPNRHSGIDSVRDMAWNSACGCLEYTSKTNRS